MPLLGDLSGAGFDEATQVMLATVYLDVCRELDTPATPLAKLTVLRKVVSSRIVGLAKAGERDPYILKREALLGVRGS